MSSQEFIWDYNIPYVENVEHNVLVSEFENGNEQRRLKWNNPRRSYAISLKGKSKTVIDQVWNFYLSRRGIYESFYFENKNESPKTNETIGVGDGTSISFSLDYYPVMSGDIGVTVGGVAYTESSDYTITRATGAITFLSTPPSGDTILATSYKYARQVRFANQMSRELFNYQLYNSEITLVEDRL